MNKLIVLCIVGLFLLSCVSGYYCIKQEDNNEVKDFKSNMNILGVKQDFKNGVSEEAIKLKIKYFNTCN